MKVDLSAFRQNYQKDTIEDMQELAAMRQSQNIGEGVHEVVVIGIHEKEGKNFKLTDKLDGTLGFSLIVRNAQKHEQMVYISVPLVVSFKQACGNQDRKLSFQFKNSVKNLQSMGIDPMLLRESLIQTDGESVAALIGTQFVIENRWNPRKLHLEYDTTAKAFYFVTSSGERFTQGEMAGPIELTAKDHTRYAEAITIASLNSYQLATQMDTTLDSHPTAKNDSINAALAKTLQAKEKKPPVLINKTSPFPIQPKKIIAPLSIEPDIDLGE